MYLELFGIITMFSNVNGYSANTVALFTLTNCDEGYEHHCENARVNEKAMRIAHAKNDASYKLCTTDVNNNASVLFETVFPFLQSSKINMTGQCLNTDRKVVFYDRSNKTIFFTYLSFYLTRFVSSVLINTDFNLIAITTELMYPAPLLDKDTFVYSYECSYEIEVQKEGIKRIKTEYNMTYITVVYLKENKNDLALANKTCIDREHSAFCFYVNDKDYKSDCFKEIFVDITSNTSVQNAINLIMDDPHMRVLVAYGYGSSINSFTHHEAVASYYDNGTLFITSFERSLSSDFQIRQHEVPNNGWYSMKVLRNIPGEHSINEILKYTYNLKQMLVDDILIFRVLDKSGMIEKYKHYLPLILPGFNITEEITFETWLNIRLSFRKMIIDYVMGTKDNIKLFLQYWKKANYLEMVDTKYVLTLPQFNPKRALEAKPYCKFTKPLCGVGHQLEHSLYKELKWLNSYGWHCAECPPNTYKDVAGNVPCQSCLYPFTTNRDKTTCYDPFSDFYITFDYGGALPVFVLSILSSLIILGTVGIFICYRDTPVVRQSNQTMSILQLLSHLVLALVPLCLFIGHPNQTSCYLKPLIIGIGFTITMSVNLSKTQKVYVIFSASFRRHNKVEVQLIGFLELLIVLVFVLIDVAILTTTFITQVPEVEHVYHDDKLIREITCNNSGSILIQLSFILVLVLGNSVQAIRARHLPSYFKETLYVIFTSFITIIMLPAIAAIYIFQETFSEKSMVLMVSVEILNIIHFSFIYLYKIYIILFKPDLNSRETFNRKRQKKFEMSLQQVL